MYARTLAQELGLEDEKKAADKAEEEKAEHASKNKRSVLFTAVLKLLFSILFTVGTFYQHRGDVDMCYECEDTWFGQGLRTRIIFRSRT